MTYSRFGFGIFLSLFFILLNLTVWAPLTQPLTAIWVYLFVNSNSGFLLCTLKFI